MSLIPKLFHFTWKNEEDLDNQFITLNDTGEKLSLRWCVNTFIEKNPDWEYKFWSDNDIYYFVCNKYPLFFDFWCDKLKTIEKIDLFRYMCLYEFGGVFIDTDCICIRPLNEFIDNFFPNAELITGQEMERPSNWINYPPHIQINIWSIFSMPKNHHIRNLVSFVIGNCISRPEMPVIEKTSMAAFGDYIYKAAKFDEKVKIVSTSFLSMDGRYKYMHGNSFGIDDKLPAYILHGYHYSWIDEDFVKYANIMNSRDSQLLSH